MPYIGDPKLIEPGKYLGEQCRKCQSWDVTYHLWESSDEAFEDYHYECKRCGHSWWIDGIDS